jgi:hypothetical protein
VLTGRQAWEMIQAQHLFDGYDEEGYHNNRVHLGEMVGLLGHPSLAFQRRSEHSTRVFDENGIAPDLLECKIAFSDHRFRILEGKPTTLGLVPRRPANQPRGEQQSRVSEISAFHVEVGPGGKKERPRALGRSLVTN